MSLMRTLKSLFDGYITASFHVALAVVAMTKITVIEFSIVLPTEIFVFIFCATLVGYNFIKFKDLFVAKGFYTTSFTLMVLCTLGCIPISIAILFLAPLPLFFLSLSAGSIVVVYAIPLSQTGRNFRSQSGAKMYLVALAWILFTWGIPLIYYTEPFSVTILLMGLVQFVYVMVAIIPFDIHDLGRDDADLRTFPLQMGVKQSKWVAVLASGVSIFVLVFWSVFSTAFVLAGVLSFTILGFCVWKTRVGQSFYLTRFWIEGIPLLWWGFMVLFS